MTNSTSKTASMDRSYDPSLAPKLTFAIGHLVIVLISAWLVFFDGWRIMGLWFGREWSLTDPERGKILLACAALYWLRHLVTLFYLLKRKVDWNEVWGLLVFFAIFEIGLVLVGGGAFRSETIDLGWLDTVALVLLLAGSYLNSFSEIQRKWWKNNPANKGHLYTEGLFRHSMHINYFGDIVLFIGWCLFTYNFWTLGLPLFMTALFIFSHIPGLDTYLAERYGEEFVAYAKRTKKLIPFIY